MAAGGGRGRAGPAASAARRADPLAPLLAGGRVVVIDGGLATELEDAGHHLGDELWSARLLADEPEAIVAAHLAYFRAGARIAITASYQATFEGFAARRARSRRGGRAPPAERELAAEARDRYRASGRRRPLRSGPAPRPGPLLVAASIGPYGAWLADGAEYRGRYGLDRRALRDFHRERLDVLWGAGPDLLACETIPDIAEVGALADLVVEAGVPGLARPLLRRRRPPPRRDSGGGGSRDRRRDAGFVAVGVNCTAPEHVGSWSPGSPP